MIALGAFDIGRGVSRLAKVIDSSRKSGLVLLRGKSVARINTPVRTTQMGALSSPLV